MADPGNGGPREWRAGTRLFSKKNSGIITGLGACVSNLKFVSLDILELLAFNPQKFARSRDVTLATPPFLKNFQGS